MLLYPVDDEYARASTSIAGKDPSLIQEEYIRLPADLATWNARYAEASEAYLEADTAFDYLCAQLSVEWRESFHDAGMKATEAGIKEKVESDRRYVNARRKRNMAEVEKMRMRGVVDAICAKRDMCISLGAFIRQELNDPRIRQEMADQRYRDGG